MTEDFLVRRPCVALPDYLCAELVDQPEYKKLRQRMYRQSNRGLYDALMNIADLADTFNRRPTATRQDRAPTAATCTDSTQWLTTGQTADALSVSGRTVLRLIAGGQLRARRAGPRLWLVDPTSVTDFRALHAA